jgi:excisionase family DNA binding protein
MKKVTMLTSKQAAEKLGFSPDYIRKLCISGTIKAEKYGNTWICSMKSLKGIKRKRHPKEKVDAHE